MTTPAHAVVDRSPVLVALSKEQCDLRASELARLEQLGANLVVEESPDAAFAFIEKTHPRLVLVGMTVGAMEGLEFLATLLKRVPTFAGQVVVVPDKGDPFPPVLQRRDPVTRKTTTETIDFPRIEKLVEELAQPKSEPVAAGAAPVPVAPATAVAVGAAAPGPSVPNAVAPQAFPETGTSAVPVSRSGPPTLLIVAAGVLVVTALGVGAMVLSRSTPPPAASVTRSAEPPTSAPPATQPAAQSNPVAPAAATGTTPAPTNGPSLEQLTTLPLSFPQSSADFAITNAEELESVIGAIRRGLGGGAKLEIGGHTSEEGAEQFNRDLSQRRANAVKRYMVSHGVPEGTIVVKAYQASAASGGAAEANRRVTVRLIP
jgi:outer membrane protein OmpA-like peptidoglycan-associated protein